ncbi:DUF2007 domain-containing protein [Agrobacterium tumefaciens]|uniref:DUF2007 domain-containing protein n=2 Tax=Rhizobium/Agrobacterium group TaxID=227290 RepID=A0AAE6B7V7_AGRTU|nr:DUF2007 domain-containing protein [Agrobacterium tumefaciens]QCL77920.1 DUF2007 domain-containing protein [Agrobacterium tumefaciens]
MPCAARGELPLAIQKDGNLGLSMRELIRTNDAVLLSFAESLMKDAGIHCLIADQAMSILEGSLGLLPRRFLVEEDRAGEARRILIDAGLGDELRNEEA